MKCNVQDECKVIYFRHIVAFAVANKEKYRFIHVYVCVLLSTPNNQLVVGQSARHARDLVDAA